jgi:hypothetical protein
MFLSRVFTLQKVPSHFLKALRWGRKKDLKYARIHFGNAPTFGPYLPQTTLICQQQIV